MYGTSEEAMKGRGFKVEPEVALSELRKHGAEGRMLKGKLVVKESSGAETILPLNTKAILEWLGY